MRTTYTLTPALREWFAAREQVVALDAALAAITDGYTAIDALPDAEWRVAYDALQAREREIGRAHADAVDAGHRVLRSLDDNERAALKDKTAVFVEPEPVNERERQ